MKKTAITIFFLTISIFVFGQEKPTWLEAGFREMKYPESDYFTGFSYFDFSQNISLQEATQQAKLEAQTDLIKKIRLQITSTTQSKISTQNINGQYSESETFDDQATTESNAEIVGLKTETYVDQKSKLVYAFSYASKYELIDYYKNSITMNLAQIEGLLQTSIKLETNREKSKARQQLEMAELFFSKVYYAQNLISAVDRNLTPDDLQLNKTKDLYSNIAQMQAMLAQNVYIYVESIESNFSKLTTIVANQVKSLLSKKGCSFVDNPFQADFYLNINAMTRHHSDDYGFVCCYADVKIILVDNYKEKTVFQDEFSQKGVAKTEETAGRKSLEDSVSGIIERILPWIK